MINEKHVEIFFDCLDESAMLLYHTQKISYLSGIVKTCENILANSANEDDEELNKKLYDLIHSISNIEFNKEEIRKAFQYAVLKGFKHVNISNQMITPESIAMLMSYLIGKLYDFNRLRLYDPLCGTGNLMAAIANQFKEDIELVGVDHFGVSYELSQALFGLLDYGNQLFFQDTLTSNHINADVIVSDFSAVDLNIILNIINHQSNNIKSDGYFIFMVDNQFFETLNVKDFIQEIQKKWHFFGMMILPKEVFKTQEKTVIILQDKGEFFVQPTSFMMVEIPSFSDQTALENVIGQLNQWFIETKFYKYQNKGLNT